MILLSYSYSYKLLYIKLFRTVNLKSSFISTGKQFSHRNSEREFGTGYPVCTQYETEIGKQFQSDATL